MTNYNGKIKKNILLIVTITFMAIFFFLSVLPFVWTAITSFKHPVDAFSMPPKWNFKPTLDYYMRLISEENYMFYFKNSAIVAAVSVVVSLAIGSICGYGLSRYSKGSSFVLLTVAMLFRALPRMVFLVPFYNISRILGIYDTRLLLILVTIAINQPFTIWMLRSFFMTIPASLDEAAMVDGCTRFGAFRHVIAPIMSTGVVTAGLFTLLLAYNEYMIPSALTSTRASTLPIMIAQFGAEDIKFWSISAAANILIAIPIVILILTFQKYLIKGMASGAVKE